MNEQLQAEIIHAVNSGKIYKLPKEKLEQFHAALSTANAYTYFGVHQYKNYKEIVKSILAELAQHESAHQIASSINNNQKWWNKPVSVIFFGAMGAVLAALIFWTVNHYLHLRLN